MPSLPARLITPRHHFSPDVLRRQAERQGFAQANTLEALLWDYELLAQMQARDRDALRLKGGAAVQLYVPADFQRASVDIDLATLRSVDETRAMLTHLSETLGADGLYFRFQAYEPKVPASTPGLFSFTVLVPSVLGQEWRLDEGTVASGRMIKLDFHRLESLPPGEARDAVVLGLPMGFRAVCVGRGYLIAEKLLTQARHTVGVPDSRYEDLPKHLYDLVALTAEGIDAEVFSEIAAWLPRHILQKGAAWSSEAGMHRVLDDLEACLGAFAVIDHTPDRGHYVSAVSQLQTLYLGRSGRWPLHRWATASARMLALVRLLRAVTHVPPGKELQFQAFQELAERARSHPKAAALSAVLFAELPEPLRRIRPLCGSPPGRLYWLLASARSLSPLEGLISTAR